MLSSPHTPQAALIDFISGQLRERHLPNINLIYIILSAALSYSMYLRSFSSPERSFSFIVMGGYSCCYLLLPLLSRGAKLYHIARHLSWKWTRRRFRKRKRKKRGDEGICSRWTPAGLVNTYPILPEPPSSLSPIYAYIFYRIYHHHPYLRIHTNPIPPTTHIPYLCIHIHPLPIPISPTPLLPITNVPRSNTHPHTYRITYIRNR